LVIAFAGLTDGLGSLRTTRALSDVH